MFLQLVTPSSGATPSAVKKNVESLFQYHPLQIAAIVETTWRNRYNSSSCQFVPWPKAITDPLLAANQFDVGYKFNPPNVPVPILPASTIKPPAEQPGIKQVGANPNNFNPTNWDHLIYAYLVENTRIFDIFSKLLETYMFTERLEIPSVASQNFWRNVEYLIYGDGAPAMVWTTTSRLRRDEISNRLSVYYRMFGLDLSHAAELGAAHPFEKAENSNREFIGTFEAFGREVWRGISNARNTSGENDTDNQAIATAARRLYDMLTTRRLYGNLSREEFRAVSLMSFLHLAVMYDSPPVVDLKATGSSPEQRLIKLADRVGMKPHSQTKPLFDLSQPFSVLLQAIESGIFNLTGGAGNLYATGSVFEPIAEVVIDQYSLATGRDLKAQPASLVERAGVSRLPRRLPAGQLSRGATVGHRNGNRLPVLKP